MRGHRAEQKKTYQPKKKETQETSPGCLGEAPFCHAAPKKLHRFLRIFSRQRFLRPRRDCGETQYFRQHFEAHPKKHCWVVFGEAAVIFRLFPRNFAQYFLAVPKKLHQVNISGRRHRSFTGFVGEAPTNHIVFSDLATLKKLHRICSRNPIFSKPPSKKLRRVSFWRNPILPGRPQVRSPSKKIAGCPKQKLHTYCQAVPKKLPRFFFGEAISQAVPKTVKRLFKRTQPPPPPRPSGRPPFPNCTRFC